MISAALLLNISLGFLLCSLFVAAYRLYLGPLTLDRVNAINLLGTLVMALLLVFGYAQRDLLLLEAALLLNLISVSGVVALNHYLLKRGRQ